MKQQQRHPTKQTHIHQTSTHFLQLTFDCQKGLTIRVTSPTLASLHQHYILNISDQTMSGALRNVFDGVYGIYVFLRNQGNWELDLEGGVLRLKIVRIVGSRVADESVKLGLERREIGVDRFLGYLVRMEVQGVMGQLRKQIKGQDYQQEFRNTNEKLEKLKMETQKLKMATQSKYNRGKIFFILFFILFVCFTVPIAFQSKNKGGSKNIGALQVQELIAVQIAKQRTMIRQEFQTSFSELRVEILEIRDMFKTKINQYDKDLSAFKRNIEQKIAKSAKIKEEVTIQIPTKQSSQTKELQKLVAQLAQQLKMTQQRYSFLEQALQEYKKVIDQMKVGTENKEIPIPNNEQQPSCQNSNASMKGLEKQLQRLQNSIKRLSIFDLSSKFIDSFEIDGSSATALAATGRRTQILLRDDIPFDRSNQYKFRIVHSTANSVIIGVIDSTKAKDLRSSIGHQETIAYSGKGEFWKNGQKLQEANVGFDEGSVVIMTVQLWKGTIKWSVNGVVVQETSSESLKNNFIKFRPYLEMSNKGDIVQLVPVVQL